MGLTRIRAQQISNIDYKQAVRVVTTTNIANLAGGAPNSVDSVNLTAGDRILVTGQDTGSQNGLYYVATLGTGSNGTWTRTSDGNETGEIEAGMVVMVTEGATYADTPWKLTTNDPIVVGTTALVFVQFSSGSGTPGGSNTQIQFNSANTFAGSSSLTWNGSELFVNGTANVTGNVTGNYFFGNGSQLTGIQAGAVTTVSSSPPGSPAQGDIWIDSDTGIQYIYFTASGNSQWAEMESETSISISSLDYGNANVLAYLTTGVAGNILPSANVTYDLGSTANRWNDIWLANSTIYLGEANISASGTAVVLPANTTVGGATIVASPLISAIDYPGDDTAADPAGGQTISIEGANFQSGAAVYVDGGLVGVVSFISSSVLQFVSPAKSAGSYSLYVVNPNGATAIAVPGIQYSGTPTWSTAAGNIGAPYETTAFATTVVATGDAPISYSVAAGNSLPTNMALTTANGYLSVATVPVTNNDTTYNFNIVATDAEQQDTPRQFSVTYKTDVVTWNSPANASSYTWETATANTVSLSASSAAGKSVSYTVQSGSLPSNIAISGNLITGTPNVVQSNTSVIIRATAADTLRYADRTLYFTTVNAGDPYWNNVAYLFNADGLPNGNLTIQDRSLNNVSVTSSGASVNTSIYKFGTGSYYFANNYVYGFDSTPLNLGAGDWTIEFWFYMTGAQTGSYILSKFSITNPTNGQQWSIRASTGDGYLRFYRRSDGLDVSAFPTGGIATNTWHFGTVVKSSNVIRVYVNGQQSPTPQTLSDTNNYTNPYIWGMGVMDGGNGDTIANGLYLDDIRVTKGVARYTGNFTPPTAPFPTN